MLNATTSSAFVATVLTATFNSSVPASVDFNMSLVDCVAAKIASLIVNCNCLSALSIPVPKLAESIFAVSFPAMNVCFALTRPSFDSSMIAA